MYCDVIKQNTLPHILSTHEIKEQLQFPSTGVIVDGLLAGRSCRLSGMPGYRRNGSATPGFRRLLLWPAIVNPGII